jgi:mannose-6-phosphate isomerase-like protein (cupin superfamily)
MDAWHRIVTTMFGPRRPRPGIVIEKSAIDLQESESFPDASKGIVSWKTLISTPKTATDSLTVGVATCPPRQGHLCPHRHAQAEIYHIISGRGIMQIDDREEAVAAGSVVYIPGDAKHGIRNDDPTQELQWLYVFGADSFEDVKYRF